MWLTFLNCSVCDWQNGDEILNWVSIFVELKIIFLITEFIKFIGDFVVWVIDSLFLSKIALVIWLFNLCNLRIHR